MVRSLLRWLRATFSSVLQGYFSFCPLQVAQLVRYLPALSSTDRFRSLPHDKRDFVHHCIQRLTADAKPVKFLQRREPRLPAPERSGKLCRVKLVAPPGVPGADGFR
jgi:hypothetical protein